jgi:hypothetical protein
MMLSTTVQAGSGRAAASAALSVQAPVTPSQQISAVATCPAAGKVVPAFAFSVSVAEHTAEEQKMRSQHAAVRSL